MAFIDDDYDFIAGFYVKNGKFHITEKELDSYSIPKKKSN